MGGGRGKWRRTDLLLERDGGWLALGADALWPGRVLAAALLDRDRHVLQRRELAPGRKEEELVEPRRGLSLTLSLVDPAREFPQV